MKTMKMFAIVAMTAALAMSCNNNSGEVQTPEEDDYNAALTASPASQKIAADGTAPVTFNFVMNSGKIMVDAGKKYTATISFEATGGTVSPASASTDANGSVTVTFTTPDPKTFTGGTVKGTIIKVKENDKTDGLFQQGSLATATATILPLDADEPEQPEEPGSELVDDGLKKANSLKDNVYVIDGKTIGVEDLPEGEGMRDYIVYGEKKDSEGVTRVFFIEFGKEHPEYATVGGGMIHIAPDQIGKEIDMLSEDPDGVAWMNLFSLKDVNQGYNAETNPSTDFGTGGDEARALLDKATCKISKNSDGSYTALAYFKTKDGKEAYFKMKATREANW